MDEDLASKILAEKELEIEVDLGLEEDLRRGIALAISLITYVRLFHRCRSLLTISISINGNY